jgi:hypothetical protein
LAGAVFYASYEDGSAEGYSETTSTGMAAVDTDNPYPVGVNDAIHDAQAGNQTLHRVAHVIDQANKDIEEGTQQSIDSRGLPFFIPSHF